jgi:hypothetical protein
MLRTSEKDNKLRAILSKSASTVGDAAMQVPRRVLPRYRPNSLFERLSIPSCCVYHVLSSNYDRDKNTKLNFHNYRTDLATYDFPAARDQLNQDPSHISRSDCCVCQLKDLMAIEISSQKEGISTTINRTITTSGSFFEEDQSTLSNKYIEIKKVGITSVVDKQKIPIVLLIRHLIVNKVI